MPKSSEQRDWLKREPNEKLSKKLKIVAWIVSGAIFVLVGMMRRPELRIPLPGGVSLDFLPGIHALINGTVAVCLLAALSAVRAGKISRHKNLMLVAISLSVLFLLGYVAYHFTTVETLFGDRNHDAVLSLEELRAVGTLRPFFLLLLVTHIIAAGVSLPLILLTFIAALTSRFQTHRNMARWVFPIWLYVAITGPICYLMLRPYY